MTQMVYRFDEGKKEMKSLLGGKGANLAEMVQLGLPVPPGFTISTEACLQYYQAQQRMTEELLSQIEQAIVQLEQETGKQLGGVENPLLVSVRSGAVFSMPGMMDTILNLGLNDETVEGLSKLTQNDRFAFDCYRRFIQMFGNVVLEVDHYLFEQIIQQTKEEVQVELDTELTAMHWKQVIEQFKELIHKRTGQAFPQEPKQQLRLSIEAVFRSWNNQRAKIYRRVHRISDDLGTAVNVQMMVFGNMGNDSGTGVAFTRNPSTGERMLYGEFLINAQGEDVVAGVRTPKPIVELADKMPAIFEQFKDIGHQLEKHYRDMQDIEFTVERKQLYILQTRSGKRTAQAAISIAVQLVEEGLIDQSEALLRVDPEQLNQMLHPHIDEHAERKLITKGLPASPGAATGAIVFTADEAVKLAEEGQKVILVRPETTPEDIHGILAAEGVLTSRGGMTSHAAVVARGMGKACVCGCEQVRIDLKQGKMIVGKEVFYRGDLISIDGGSGQVIEGEVPLIDPDLSEEFQQLLSWADQIRTLRIRSNADNPEDAKKAIEFGAEGIGLCRTEHMFMDAERVPIVRKMILADTSEERSEALQELLPMQVQDFTGIFEVMAGRPVTIRLLDPPLHEFLPHTEDLVVEIVQMQHQPNPDQREIMEKEDQLRKVRAMQESNPMLGHRGCRLGLIHPEIYRMQVEAIFRAARTCSQNGMDVQPEIMIPLVGHANELKPLREMVIQVANEMAVTIPYTIGTMIEVPRAALTAEEIAEQADFFSFGTNDLTQTTFGYSRDDAEGKFLHQYVENKILPHNPFVTIDKEGVGSLVERGVQAGKQRKETLITGVCGEHGGDKESIDFFHQIGLDYVSCSPYRVPLARLAAAQAVIDKK